MAKKPSRKQRKVIREKHQRAQAHGLPARALERPSKPAPADWDVEHPKRSSRSDDEDERRESETGSQSPTLLERLKSLPAGAKLAAVVVLLVIVIGVVATLRRR